MTASMSRVMCTGRFPTVLYEDYGLSSTAAADVLVAVWPMKGHANRHNCVCRGVQHDSIARGMTSPKLGICVGAQWGHLTCIPIVWVTAFAPATAPRYF